jgi:glucose/arabinose dehydrogenase
MTGLRGVLVLALAGCAIAGCGEVARLSVAEGTVPPAGCRRPRQRCFDRQRRHREGLAGERKASCRRGPSSSRAFPKGLDHPRWVYGLPNGDVLVAESNAPPRPDDGKGIKAAVMKMLMKKAGAGVPEREPHHAARDADATASRNFRSVLLEGLNSPFGMALVGKRYSSPIPMRC